MLLLELSCRCATCQRCLNNISALIDSQQNTPSANVSDAFVTWCLASNRSSASCSTGAAAIQKSYAANFGRRAGAVCVQLGECSSSLPSNCTLTAGSGSGTFSDCTVNGLSSGNQVSGINPPGVLTGGTTGRCLSDSDCNGANMECSSAVTSTVWTCKGGFDFSYKFSTCQAKFVPAVQAVVTPCQACQTCIATMAAVTNTTKDATDRSGTQGYEKLTSSLIVRCDVALLTW